MSHITLRYSLSNKNTRTYFLWIQSSTAQLVLEFFHEIVLNTRTLVKPSSLKKHWMAIDMTLFDDCTDGGWLTIFGETARQELAFPPAYLQPVAPLKGVLLTRQSTFNLGLKLPVELVLGNTTCSK